MRFVSYQYISEVEPEEEKNILWYLALVIYGVAIGVDEEWEGRSSSFH